MLIIKYPDQNDWISLIRSCMPLTQFCKRYGMNGASRIQNLVKANALPLKTVVFMSEAIEEILEEKQALEEMRKAKKEAKEK